MDQSPLEYATAALYKQQDSTLVTGIITNEEGVFTIKNTQGGLYYVGASFMGYQTAVKSNIEIRRRNEKKELGAQINLTENWSNFIGANIYSYSIDGSFDNRPVQTDATIHSINANSTVRFWKTASAQFTFNYLSARNTAQGEDSRFYSPNLTLRKTFLDDRLVTTLQWQNIDMGLLDTNEQRITTYRPNEFYTTTNYVYEVDMVLLNLSYTFKNSKNRSKFIDSEFGKREF